jgi:hypothetical protein
MAKNLCDWDHQGTAGAGPAPPSTFTQETNMDEAIAEILADVEGHCHSGAGNEFPNADSFRLLAAEVVRLDVIYGKLLDACIKASLALETVRATDKDGEAYYRCPVCNGGGGCWSDVSHNDGCTAVLINRALNDVECGSP